MTPSTDPVAPMLTSSTAVTVPVASPNTTTDFASPYALTRPRRATVTTCCGSSIFPSTAPTLLSEVVVPAYQQFPSRHCPHLCQALALECPG